MATPSGWAQDSGNPNKYNATLTIPTGATPQTGAASNAPVKVKVDNSTGNISLISGTTEFYNYNATSNSWSPPSDSTSRDTYNQIFNLVGNTGINLLTSTAKLGAVKVINGTSTSDNIDTLKATNGYTGSLNNVSDDDNVGISSARIASAFGDINNISAESVQRKYDFYSYPLDPGRSTDDQDIIEFTQFQYGKRSIDTSSTTLGTLPSRNTNTRPVPGSVTLAIPTGIRDSNRVNWRSDDANPFVLEAAKISLQAMKNPGNAARDAINRFGDAYKDPATYKFIETSLAAKAAGLNNALARFNGAILNPNTELLFGGPSLRDFAYTIEMTPREKAEAEQIRNIIRFFKEGMAPRRTVGGLFLQSPNVFAIKYKFNGDPNPHPYINKVKEHCALLNCSIDYTPQNTYMTHDDGSMIAYRMTLQFTELEPVYYDDYGPSEDTQIVENFNDIGF